MLTTLLLWLRKYEHSHCLSRRVCLLALTFQLQKDLHYVDQQGRSHLLGWEAFTILLSSLLPVSSLVAITSGANPTAGQPYTLTCTVAPPVGLTGTPTVQWVGPGSSATITTGGDFTVRTTPPYTLTINPLRQSYDGEYTCQATIGSTTGSTSTTLTVQGD